MRDFTYPEIIFALIWATRWTILLSGMAFVCGGTAGLMMTLIRISPLRPIQLIGAAYIEVIQGIPLLIQFLLAFFGLSVIGIEISPWAAATLALTTFTSAFLADIWRGSIRAIPKGQWEASSALSLNYFQQLGLIILPQAVRTSIPPTVGFLVQVIKGTSLASAIGFIELARSATNITNVTFDPFFVYLSTAIIYFLICFPVSILSRRLEKRLAYD
ncbi:MAG: amino acid ABC transporter permease [Leptolyngbya sp. SIO1D8]|nr:amino acid ABC transporter permease [Leptolyngbya sp. SIO1D8]